MSLDVFFNEDIRARLLSLHQANSRALALAQKYGMDREAAELVRAAYSGCLTDVALAFGLVLKIPNREEVKQVERPNRGGRGYGDLDDLRAAAGCEQGGLYQPGQALDPRTDVKAGPG